MQIKHMDTIAFMNRGSTYLLVNEEISAFVAFHPGKKIIDDNDMVMMKKREEKLSESINLKKISEEKVMK